MTSHTNICTECRKSCAGITCSVKCRKHRQRRKAEARMAMSLAIFELSKIRDSLKRREDVPKFIGDLNRLKSEVNDLLLLAGDTDAVNKHQMLTEFSRKRSV